MAAPEPGRTGLAERVDPLPGHGDRAAGRPVQAGDEVQQRRLAAAGRAHHGDRLAGSHPQLDPVHRGLAPAAVALGYVAELYQSIHARQRRPGGHAQASAVLTNLATVIG